MPAPFFRPPEPGDVIADKYRMERVLGVGGMGMVIAAHHLQLDERVALKFLLPETTFSTEAVKRFVREARAAVKIKSDHVARVSDVGTLEDGVPYLVMEYLEGADLAAELERRGPLGVEEAVEVVLQAGEAIAEAHALGIVHRDLKPANLFLTRRAGGVPWVKVLDFGISKISRGPDVGMTSTTAVMGSPLYMSPEQIRAAKEVDARADIWALGVILYELLCGRLPFQGDTLPQLSVKIAIEPPEPFPAMTTVPAPLQAVVMRCLEKERERRYLHVAELAVALAPFANKRAVSSIDRIAAVLGATGVPDSTGVGPSSATHSAAGKGRSLEAPAAQATGFAQATGSAFGGTGVDHAAGKSASRRGLIGVIAVLGTVGAAGTLFLLRSSTSTPATAASLTPAAALPPPQTTAPTTATQAPTATPTALTPPPSFTPPATSTTPSATPTTAPSSPETVPPNGHPAPLRTRRPLGSHTVQTPARPEPPSPAPAPTPETRPPAAPTPAPAPAAPVDVFNTRKF